MQKLFRIVVLLVLVAGLAGSASAQSTQVDDTPTFSATWLAPGQARLDWTWPENAIGAAIYVQHTGGQPVYVGEAKHDQSSLTLPPGDPPYDADYRPASYDSYEIRFYQSDLIFQRYYAALGLAPGTFGTRVWLPVAER